MKRLPKRFPRAGRRRSGFTLVELSVAALLLAAVMLTAIPMLGWIARQRQAIERHQAAVLEIGNLMERLTLLPFDEVTTERVGEFVLSEGLRRQLPDANLKISVLATDDDPSAKRLTIELRWHDATPGAPASSVRLAAWIYRQNREMS